MSSIPKRLGYEAGRALGLLVKFAAFVVAAWLVIKGIDYAFTHWLGGRPDPDSAYATLGWVFSSALLTWIVVNALRPRNLRQRDCMHHDPRWRNPDTGAPTTSWVNLDTTNTDPRWRKFWCSGCLKVFLFPIKPDKGPS